MIKPSPWLIKFALYLSILLTLVSVLMWLFADCRFGPMQRSAIGHEEGGQMSPDGLSRAFVWLPEPDTSGAAAIPQPYQVWIKSFQGDKEERVVFESDMTKGIRLVWRSAGLLEICYGEAHINDFSNFFRVSSHPHEDYPHDDYEVEIVLKKAATANDCQT